MTIGIHHKEGSFSERWIEYCEENNINYKVVNAYKSDIVDQLKNCDALMWHHHHGHYKDVISAKPILFALEHAGKRVFPNFRTGWHFDDKVAQKYLLEAVKAPLVPSYVFYDMESASAWARGTTYPKVFKLRGGAGSSNVRLVRSKKQCLKLITTAFGKGFSQFNRFENLKERLREYREGRGSLLTSLKGIGRLFIPPEFAKLQHREREYVYFQDYIPNNNSDIRVIVIDGKAFALKRLVRQNDFRASGSGNIIYDVKEIPLECIKIAFVVRQHIGSTCICFDFVINENNEYLIVEISYGFAVKPYDYCEGFWTEDMQFHVGEFNPQGWMVEAVVRSIGS